MFVYSLFRVIVRKLFKRIFFRPKIIDGSMIVGADVTHPSPGSDGFSIAAVIEKFFAFCDRKCMSINTMHCRWPRVTTIRHSSTECCINYNRRRLK